MNLFSFNHKNKKIHIAITVALMFVNAFAFQNCSNGKFQSAIGLPAENSSSSIGDGTSIPTSLPVSAAPIVSQPPAPAPAQPPQVQVPAGTKLVYLTAGHAGRSMMSCDDGQTWINNRTDSNAVPDDHSTTSGRAVDSAHGYFYALYGWGYNGTLRRSRDGVNWTVIQSNNWGGGIAAGKDIFFRSVEGGGFYTSTDFGTTLTRINDASIGNIPDQLDHPSISRVNDKLFAPARNQTLAISYDQGKSWTLNTQSLLGVTSGSPFAEGNGVIISLAFDHSRGEGNMSRSIDNGKTWQDFKYGDIGGVWSDKIVFDGTDFIVWAGGMTWKSKNGLNWIKTKVKIDGVDAPSYWGGVMAYNSQTKMFVAITGENAGQKIYRSADAISWTSISSTKYKTGNTLFLITLGPMESKYCP